MATPFPARVSALASRSGPGLLRSRVPRLAVEPGPDPGNSDHRQCGGTDARPVAAAAGAGAEDVEGGGNHGSRFEIDQLAAASQADLARNLQRCAAGPGARCLGAACREHLSTSARRSAIRAQGSRPWNTWPPRSSLPAVVIRPPRFADMRQPQEGEHGDMLAPSAGSQRTYEFAHTQIRAAATLLLPALAEEAIHHQIGRGLLQSMAPAQREAAYLLVGQTPQSGIRAAGRLVRTGRIGGTQSSGQPPGAGPGGL